VATVLVTSEDIGREVEITRLQRIVHLSVLVVEVFWKYFT